MALSEFDLDAQRLETRANELIHRLNLEDPSTGNGGLLIRAFYDQKEGKFLVEDEMTFVSWSVPFSHQMKQKDWDEIYCWISSQSEHGCSGNHKHYSPY